MADSDHPGPIVHIGYHKTATTWFQQRFYPTVDGASYLPRALVRETLIQPRAFEFDPIAARRTIDRAAAGQRALLCEENLSGYLHNGGLGGLLSAAVAERIHHAMPEAQIVVFIREQASAVTASYAQYVRSGGTRSARRYLDSQGEVSGARRFWYKVPLFDLEHFRYGPLIARYADLFGEQAVHVFAYEEFLRDQRAFAARFCERLNLDVDVAALDFGARNPSLSPAGMRLMRVLNRFTRRSVIDKDLLLDVPGWYYARWGLARALLGPWMEGRAPAHKVLGARRVDAIRAHFAWSNRALADRWRLPLADLGYAVDPGDGSGDVAGDVPAVVGILAQPVASAP